MNNSYHRNIDLLLLLVNERASEHFSIYLMAISSFISTRWWS